MLKGKGETRKNLIYLTCHREAALIYKDLKTYTRYSNRKIGKV